MFSKVFYLVPAIAAALVLCACSSGHSSGNAASAGTSSGMSSSAPTTVSDALSQRNVEAATSAAVQSNLPKPDPNTPISSYITITSGNQLMFLYTALAGLPPDWDTMATKYSSDYSQSNDAFRKHDLMNALKPKMEAAIADAKAHSYLIWNAGDPQLSAYDFSRKGFPVGNGELDPNSSVYVTDNYNYHLSFINGSDFQFLPVTDENLAKQIEQMRSHGANLSLKIFAFAQSADPSNDTVKAAITEVQLLDPHGQVLLEQKAK